MPYLTPDSVPEGRICRTISIPDSLEWMELVNGALSELTKVWNYEKFGTLTPEETAEAAQDIFWEYHGSECTVIPIGMFAPIGVEGTAIPKWIWCNGADVSRATYAALFAVIGTTYGFGDSSTTFNVPDLRSKTVVGYGQSPSNSFRALGDNAGSEEITLNQTQMPVHNHDEKATSGTQMFKTGASTARQTFAVSSLASNNTNLVTGDTGGGLPHDNMPPFEVAAWYIFAGV